MSILQVSTGDPISDGRRSGLTAGSNNEPLSFSRAFQSVWPLHLERQVDPRTAASMVGISRVAEAVRLRGLA